MFASAEAAELLTILHALHNPRRSTLLNAALATTMIGYTAADIAAIGDQADQILESFQRLQQTWERHGVSSALMQLDASHGVSLNLASLPNAERALTNFRQLLEVLQRAEIDHGNRLDALLRWYANEVAGATQRPSDDERQMRLESDARAVQIVTMHAAKGLEYPFVFCLSLGRMRESKNYARLDRLNGPTAFVDCREAPTDIQLQLTKEQLADRIRLAYVALTRAQVKLWVVAGQVQNSRSKAATPLDWLLAGNPDVEFSDWLASATASGKDQRHQQELETRISAANLQDVVSVRTLPELQAAVWNTASNATQTEVFARPLPQIPRAWSTTSFSSLTREPSPYSGKEELPVTTSAEAPEANMFATAPRGAGIGTAVHNWLEQWNFDTAEASIVRDFMQQYPLSRTADANAFAAACTDMFNQLRSAVLPGLNLPVCDICRAPDAAEWNFLLPIEKHLDPQRIAAVLHAHGMENYAQSVQHLPAEAVTGFFTGFIDRLILTKDGKWGVIDWKTNDLGAAASNYTREALMQHACKHHYFLQTLFYLVALRRFVGPQTQLAGGWIIYLRGVQSQTSHGILHIQPAESLLAELDKLLPEEDYRK
ncbi:MAG: PD-(D/E)XK nuclease family protein [Verrucomicrobia bacterium]|nr:PD-(D/E)XK nuclease family protein [Verrucomicrobiota bacterium]